MATRRSASRARANTNSVPLPVPLPRSRSALAKVTPTPRVSDDSRSKEPSSAPEAHPQKSPPQIDTEKNIQVVIRCRQRSEREVQENSPSIVTLNEAKTKEITIEVSAPVSSVGVASLPPLRTYPFDLVFGPDADQSLIYHEVVAPMLEEVLKGYNCTLFAYGQTGTGKTYTMEGDLNPTPMGNPSPDAGMIPRVLFRLFHYLEKSQSDYSVKVSYIELYNEELRDLLANDLAAPIGTMQPMGIAFKDSNKPVENPLRIFDDAAKRGVTIQGLEEVAVKDSRAALALLTKGSTRRQIAATKFNDHSSRSHAIFSVTVHVKEIGIVGEDLLKVGKLNLVDLAGSENIGRSGAENKRAREAGMINQSLLTLGRVITALVDRASHVPYRESKLTRLLQDSLGGRTKTCIIATISPARVNMEETLSTLDYALRAKSIRNRPELNQRTTRNSLLKDYIIEIERLKADLVAAREKNGIYVSNETWNEMNTERELRATELQEAKKQVHVVETNLRAVREEFDESIALLKTREGELKDTRRQLHDVEQVLGKKETELIAIQTTLQEEEVVSKAHLDTELALDRIANGLKKAARHSVQDLKALFEKLERQTAILHSNTQIGLTQGKIISHAGNTLAQTLDEFITSSTQRIARIQTEARDFQTKEQSAIASGSTRMEEQMKALQQALEFVRTKDEAEAKALGAAHKIFQEMQQTFTTGFATWSSGLTKNCEAISQEIALTTTEIFSTMEATIRTTVSLADAVIREATDYISSGREMIERAKSVVTSASEAEITRLRQQNELLSRMVEAERLSSAKAKDELMQRISLVFDDFTSARDRNLQTAVENVRKGIHVGQESMRALIEEHDSIADKVDIDGATFIEVLQKRSSEGKRTRDGAFKELSSAKVHMNGEVFRLKSVVADSAASYSTQILKHTAIATKLSEEAFEQHGRAKRARIEVTASVGATTQSQLEHIRSDMSAVSQNILSAVDRVIAEGSGLSNATRACYNTASTSVASLQTASDILSAESLHEDSSTGRTPRRRTWDHVDHWDLTKPREIILKEWRERNASTQVRNGLSSEDDFASETALAVQETQAVVRPRAENVPVIEPGAARGTLTEGLKFSLGEKRNVPPLADTKNVYATRNLRRAR